MSKGKLLLADDSVTIQKVVNLTFADEGIEVVTAGNGDLAMEMIAEERPDIVLADVNMPGLTGYQICERLRRTEETKDLPVLLLVGSFEPFDEDEAKRVGASGFMTKPFQSIRHLVAQVSELLDRSGRTTQSAEISAQENEDVTDPALSATELEEPQTTDIEELYHQSFADTVEIPTGNVESGGDVADAGMDDEIIETTYVSGAAAATAVMSADDARLTSPFEERVSYESEYPTAKPNGVVTSNVRPSDEFDEPTPGRSFDKTQEMPDYAPEAIWSKVTSSPTEENLVGFQPPTSESEGKTEEAGFSLSDGELLELPGSRPIQKANETQTSAPPLSNQLTSLSPELIDVIVQKVIEKMSENKREL